MLSDLDKMVLRFGAAMVVMETQLNDAKKRIEELERQLAQAQQEQPKDV